MRFDPSAIVLTTVGCSGEATVPREAIRGLVGAKRRHVLAWHPCRSCVLLGPLAIVQKCRGRIQWLPTFNLLSVLLEKLLIGIYEWLIVRRNGIVISDDVVANLTRMMRLQVFVVCETPILSGSYLRRVDPGVKVVHACM